MPSFLSWFVGCIVLCFAVLLQAAQARPNQPRPPNIVLIFADDLGYRDIGCYGHPSVPTPNLDRLAAEGIRFTDFYVAQPVCSASRAALLTGCYPNRVGIQGALGPKAKIGLSTNEMTIARLLKQRGYKTAAFGKWHLGDAPAFLPTRHGFDEYFGLPYSNDMWPHHPTHGKHYPPLPLLEQEAVRQILTEQSQLTSWYTERAVRFIKRHQQEPFFLYLPHSMPHVPLAVSSAFEGKSGQGLYGDVLMELDWSVGQVLKAIKDSGLDEQTLVIFTSDNGPWLLYGDHAGSALPLREGKATVFEGGVRVPCLMRWPGTIPASRECREMATTMDLLPTLAEMAGASVPKDRIIDGKNIGPLLRQETGARSPHQAFFYYWGNHLQAVRSGKWKLHLPHSYPKPEPAGGGGKPGQYATPKQELALYDLEKDIGEKVNVAQEHPEIVERLQRLAEQCREDLGDSAQKRVGKNVRSAGRVP